MVNNKKKILIIFSIFLISLFIIGVSYAFFSAIIKGNDLAKENVFTSGTIELTFTDNDDAISLPHANPGDSDSKTFIVENTGTLDDTYTYNIKLTNLYVTFKKKDLTYNLIEYTDNTFKTVKDDGIKTSGYINEETVNENNEMYLAVDITRPEKGKKHYYKLTITFEELDEPQDYNQEAKFRGKINVDGEAGAKLYVPPKLFSEVIVADDITIFDDDPAGNLRYFGKTVNNYIWFNCDDYNEVIDENTAAEQNCEKWRIIGLFNNIKTIDESNEVTGTKNLVKIIRDESIGDILWDSNNTNNWMTATLQQMLNKDSDATGYLNPNYKSNGVKGITNATKGMIEKVEWNLGGTPNAATETTQGFYTAERGSTTNGSQPTIWNGYIGLMYASDYGYATAGGTKKSRQDCLDYQLYGWDTDDYTTYCANTNWLKPSSNSWTLTPHSRYSYYAVYVNRTGRVDLSYVYATIGIRPSLYLKSSVKVLDDGVSDGSVNNPYILEIEQ